MVFPLLGISRNLTSEQVCWRLTLADVVFSEVRSIFTALSFWLNVVQELVRSLEV